jgi:hypothetical protein
MPAAGTTHGFFSFTEITDPGEHRSYNEWHQLDHLPEQFQLPGIRFGQRWVSTPECRRARAVDGPTLQAVHYLTLYLMDEPIEETLSAFAELGKRLREEGRFHEHRRALLSGPFVVVGQYASARALVSAQVLPHRPHRGVYAIVDRVGTAPADLTGVFAADESVSGVWRFQGAPELGARRWSPGERQITLCFLDQAPLDAADRLGSLLGNRAEDVELAGPFETIEPWCWDWFDYPAGQNN